MVNQNVSQCNAILKEQAMLTTHNAKQAKGLSMEQHNLCFIENKGQVSDQYGNARNDIDFKVATGNRLNVFVGRGGLHYQWTSPRPSPKEREVLRNADCKGSGDFSVRRNDGLDGSGGESGQRVEIYRMDVELIGANRNAEIVTEEKQSYYEHYYTETSPDLSKGEEKGVITNHEGIVVRSYKKVTYKNVYPNIDWVLYVGEHRLTADHPGLRPPLLKTRGESMEYDFVVRPGGNVKDIQLKYGGDTSLVLNVDGDIIASTPMGKIMEEKPYSYVQGNREEIASAFKMNGNILGFDLRFDSYRGKGTIVIDPTLAWATYYGGTGVDEAWGVDQDGQGNVYFTGNTSGAGNIVTIGAYQTTFGGNMDAFVTKFNSNGAIQWATYFGGSNVDEGGGLKYDRHGKIYISGSTSSTNHIATLGAYQTTNGGNTDAFLAKFDTSGNLQWATFYT